MRAGAVVGGRFTIERRAGAGGMGTVYRALDRERGAHVALKLLKGDGPTDQTRFAREARVLSKLDHQGIVRYIDHGFTAKGELYLAMEWLEGEDLAARLEREVLSVEQSLILVRAAAEALGAAHARGVVHRDVKPSNLFLPGFALDHIKVLDFGIARLPDASRVVTSTGRLLGTPAYMAPEQARGERELDARVDVFSLGCVLFECLTGRPPFEGAHLAVLAKILFEEAPRVRELRGDVPRALDALVTRMLSKDIAERPRDGSAVAAELATVLDPSIPRIPSRSIPSGLTSGEQRLVSVILVDLIGRMDDTTPTLSIAESDARFEELRGVAARFGAQYQRLYGGAGVATLAGRGSAKDQVVHAARCALAMRAAFPRAAFSLATGRCLLHDRLPIGEAIDRAVALLDADDLPAPPSRAARFRGHDAPPPSRVGRPVRVDALTAGLLDPRFDVTSLAGSAGLWGEREHGAEAVRTVLGKPTPCVGRDRELATLAAMFFECASDAVARAVLVTGVTGIGKSRVRHEFLASLRGSAQPIKPWLAAGNATCSAAPYHLLGQLLRAAIGVTQRDPPAARRDALRARVAARLPPAEAPRVTALLGEILGAPLPDEACAELLQQAARGDPRLMVEQTRRAFQDFLAAELAAEPVIIVIEDLQGGDHASIQALDAALRTHRERPLMVVAFASPEVHDLFPRLWVERNVQEIRLSELSRKASERLVRQVLGGAASPAVVERITARAAGNPFCLEELIRAEAEGKGAEAPATVLAVVEARLSALPPEARRIVRAASVFGQVFWEDGVRALLGDLDAASNLEPWFRTLIERELIVRHPESRFEGQVEYAFQHALVREGAYGMLTEADRALGHQLAGAWLERGGEEEPARLAEHRERGRAAARPDTLDTLRDGERLPPLNPRSA